MNLNLNPPTEGKYERVGASDPSLGKRQDLVGTSEKVPCIVRKEIDRHGMDDLIEHDDCPSAALCPVTTLRGFIGGPLTLDCLAKLTLALS